MNVKSLLILTVSLIFTTQGFSQILTQTVKGRVLDSNTKRPLPGTSIVLLNSNPLQGTTTDLNGYFRLEKVPVGRQSFSASFMGYENALVSEILVGSAKEIVLSIQMIELLNQVDEIVITSAKDNIKANNKMATVSARSFDVAETKRFPASLADPSRMALSFAGVTTSDDSSNEILVRGNAPNQLLWKVEGIEVPEPNHFSEEGFSAGAIGMISTNLLGKSDFFTGAFPAEYGNALSGVFDIKLRNGNADKNEYAFQFGILGTDLAIEGPFSKNYKGSYLVNYRYSSLAILSKVVDIVDGSVPTYQDLSFKLNIPLSNKTELSLWGIGGISESDSEPEINNAITVDDFFDSKTYMSGINLQHFINNKTTLNVIASYSGNESNYEDSSIDSDNNTQESSKYSLKNNALRSHLDITHKFNSKTTLQAGTILSHLTYNIIDNEIIDQVKQYELNESNSANMAQGFVQAKHRFNNKISSTFGLHSTYFSLNNNLVLEPRAGVTYKINPKHTLNIGFGIHSRRMNLNQYFTDADLNDDVFTNKNLDLMQANHYIIGYDWRIIKNGHLKVEAYYQDINKVGVVENGESTSSIINGNLLISNLTDTGTARNYGIELTFEKFFSNQYYFLTTASLFDSKYKASDNNWYNSSFNSNYTFNIVGGKEFTVRKNNIIGVNGKILLNGGKRNSPVDLDNFRQTGEIYTLQEQRNSISLDDYFRADISGYYRINRPKVSHIISLDIQNITNKENIESLYFNRNTETYAANYQIGLLPFFNYRIEF